MQSTAALSALITATPAAPSGSGGGDIVASLGAGLGATSSTTGQDGGDTAVGGDVFAQALAALMGLAPVQAPTISGAAPTSSDTAPAPAAATKPPQSPAAAFSASLLQAVGPSDAASATDTAAQNAGAAIQVPSAASSGAPS